MEVGEGERPQRELVDGERDDAAGGPIVERRQACATHDLRQRVEGPLQAGQVAEQEGEDNRRAHRLTAGAARHPRRLRGTAPAP